MQSVPSFYSQSTGVATLSSNTILLPWPTSIPVGGCAFISAEVWGSVSRGLATPSGWSLVAQSSYYGTSTNFKTYIYVYGTTDVPTPLTGTESGTVAIAQSSASDSAGRNNAIMATFTGHGTVWHYTDVDVELNSNAVQLIKDNDVTTTVPYSLAVNFVQMQSAQATPVLAFTGQTGGTWIKNVSEDAGTVAYMVQTAQMPSIGTISGGSATAQAFTSYANVGLALYADYAGSSNGTLGPLEAPSFCSTLLSTAALYKLQSTAGRLFSGPANRLARVTVLSSTAPCVAAFGTSDIVASSSEGILVVPPFPYEQHLSPSYTHISLASSTDVTVNVTLSRY